MKTAISWVAALAMAAVLLLSVPVGQAGLTVEDDDETFGATTVSWTSGFVEDDYRIETELELRVEWTVERGVAEFEAFAMRFPFFTPTDPFDPVDGEMRIIEQGDDFVRIGLTFTALHWSEEDERDKGNAHMSLFLMVDESGDGNVDTRVQLGVNVHVEDPESDGDRADPGPIEERPRPDEGRPGEGPGNANPEGPPSWVPQVVQDMWTELWDRLRALFG